MESEALKVFEAQQARTDVTAATVKTDVTDVTARRGMQVRSARPAPRARPVITV